MQLWRSLSWQEKKIGLTGSDLRDFVTEQMDNERQERAAHRELERAKAEAKAETAKAEAEAAKAAAKAEAETATANKTLIIKINMFES